MSHPERGSDQSDKSDGSDDKKSRPRRGVGESKERFCCKCFVVDDRPKSRIERGVGMDKIGWDLRFGT